jgi:ABC-type antimicrobial peptide transport system permease subunit
MIARFRFYLGYASKNLFRSGQWTSFAVFCVAAGVATVVALRSLGLAITDSLLSNLRQYNHGDINVSSIESFGPFSSSFQRGSNESNAFNPDQIANLQGWAANRNAHVTAYIMVSSVQIAPLDAQQVGRPQFASTLFIDPISFTQLNRVVAIDPAGVPLDQLFTGGNEVVISQNMADTQHIKVGDAVRVSGTEELFSVRGIVPTEAEANIQNAFAAFFGFAYFEIHKASMLGVDPNPNGIGINLPDGASEYDINQATGEVGSFVPNAREISTTPFLLRRNKEVSDMVGRFIVVMGLGAMLIGGVGIMNTMLVLVRRRSMEIASLKTFGMKGRQIAALFTAEAFLLGLMGSLVGMLIGTVLGGVVNRFGEAFLQQKLPWKVYPEALIFGLGLGMAVTMVFGLLPVLTATKVRPGSILRPNETVIPRAGILQSLLALVVVVVVLGLIAGQIVGPALDQMSRLHLPSPSVLGIIGVALTLLFLAFLTFILWILVWIIGKLPTFGNVELRLALRNLSTHRWRTATTLLALTAGMFALSGISYFGLGASEIVRIQFAQTLGGNVMLMPLLPKAAAQPVIDLALAYQEGIQYKTILNFNFGRITTADGKPIIIEERQREVPVTLLIRESNNPTLNSGPVREGRDLTPEDRGKNVIVLSEQSSLEATFRGFTLAELGIHAGSHVRMRIGGTTKDFEVIGIVGSANGFAPNIAGGFLPPDVPGIDSPFALNVVQVTPEHLNEVLLNLSGVPLIFSVDVTFIDGLIRRLIDQLAAIPTVVGLLSLLAAAVIMANTVALAILERRRQIGILKAIGLSRGRVLRIVLLENTIVGLLGGLLGIGLSSLGVSLMTSLGAGITIPIPTGATLITIGLLVASIVIAWIATLLSARVAVRERVLRVLRYE